MEACPLFGYLIFAAQFPGLCLHPLDVMTLFLQNWLVLSEDLDPFLCMFSLLKVSTVHQGGSQIWKCHIGMVS